MEVRRTRRTTETRDPVVAERALARTHDTLRLDVVEDGVPFRFTETVVESDRIALESTACNGVVSGVVRTGDQMVVTWMKRGRGTIGEHRAPLGRPILFHASPERFRWTSFEQDSFRIDRRVVEAVAAERGGWTPQPLEFKPHHVPEGATLAAWWLMVRQVATDILQGPDTVSAEHELELTRNAAAGILTAIPHWPSGAGGSAPARARLARAEAFLLEHVTEALTIEEVARAAGMSPRGVQAAFQRAHSMTPLRYLRGIRLQMARDLLENAAVESVADAAQQVAFPHLGRFAAAYRAEFGELPGHTLRTARDEHTTPIGPVADGSTSMR